MKEVIKAARAYDRAAMEATRVNALKKDADREKQQNKRALLNLMEKEEEQLDEGEEFHGVTLTIKGRKVTFAKQEKLYARITNLKKFKEWAEQDDSENWFDPEPRIREDLLNDHVNICIEEERPLPPGVEVYVDQKISRTTRPA